METEDSISLNTAGANSSSNSTIGYELDTSPTASASSALSMTSSTSTPSNTVIVSQGTFPKIILQLMEQGLMSPDEQIEELLTGLQYSRNIYALKYILEHKGDSVSVEMLTTAVNSLCLQEFDKVFSGETVIKLEWQLRIIIIILEAMFQNECQFTCQFLDDIRQATSMYKRAHSKIMQHGGEIWKSNYAEFNKSEKTIGSFKCNYNSRYLLKLIKNTLNAVSGDKTPYQTSIDRAIAALKGLLVAVPGLAKVGIKLLAGVDIPLGEFNIERSWKYFTEAFYVEPSGKPWYTTWRRLIILQDCLDKWCEQESAISTSFKERVLLEYLWYHISLCYAEEAAENNDVSDELWFGILDIIQQLIQKTFSTTTQAICYYMALDSLNNATTESIQFKSIEVLLSLEVKNSELFVTTPDDISGCDGKYIPKMVSMYYYLKRKLEVESKMISKYSPSEIMTNFQNKKQDKGKGKCVEKSPIDCIAEDLTCAIVCETVSDFYQLYCQHIISSKAFLSLNSLECPYCRSEIRKDKVYYIPQQIIYNNVQHYMHITDIDGQDTYDAKYNAGNNADVKIFDEDDDLKKQKRKNRTRKYDSESTLVSIWKSLTAPNIDKLLQKAKAAYTNNKLEKALNIYTQILQVEPTNCQALCNRAMIKIKMKNFGKALFDIETAIEVDKSYYDPWYLRLMAHLCLGNKKGVKQDIEHKHSDMQKKAFNVINEYVNKLEHFDVEWFKLLVDSCPHYAMNKSDDINRWQLLCSHQYGTDDYARWYNTATSWYNTYNNTPRNRKNTNAFFEKVFYMHKSHLKAHFLYESHVDDINECITHYNYGYLSLYSRNKVTIPIFKVLPNKYKLGILLGNINWKSMTLTIVIKTSIEEIQYTMDIKHNDYHAEYILPCAVNVLSEDDIIIDIVTHFETNLYWVCLYSEDRLDTMERNLKIETFSNGVKMIDYYYRQYYYLYYKHRIYDY